MKLVDMKMTKADREKTYPQATLASDMPSYPYGLTLSLDDSAINKLGLSSMPKVDSEWTLVATVNVTSVSSNESTDGGKHRNLGLQITAMALEKRDSGSITDHLYGDKK